MFAPTPKNEVAEGHRPLLVQQARRFLADMMRERLTPEQASAAVFVGVFVGIVPIYGMQSLVAIALAVILKLNKPLTFAATFVNNPLLQPLLVFASVELGHVVLKGSLLPLTLAGIRALRIGDQLAAWLAGSLVLAVLLGGMAACATFVFLRIRARGERVDERTDWPGFLNLLFATCPPFDRRFVKWKIRFDRLFGMLAADDLGRGPVVDLGCGYGIVLGLAAFQDRVRRFTGCDIDPHRIEIARRALTPFNAELSVSDVRSFEFGDAGLILIIDVLQYLSPSDQSALLERCCSALLPEGKLIFRVHDRERGLASKLSLALDRVIFLLNRNHRRPAVLAAAEYRRMLEAAGMEVRELPFTNRLPLAHVLFTATKPGARQDPQ